MKKSKRKICQAYLSENYDVVNNTVINRIEIKAISETKYKPLTDTMLDKLATEIDAKTEYMDPSNSIIDSVLKGALAQDYNPIQEYFKSLPDISESNGAIERFSKFVKIAQTEGLSVDSQSLFYVCLSRWAIASVANVFELDGNKNDTCIVLVGGQGAFKTTYLNLFCPKDLVEYSFSGNIDLHSKETPRMLCEKFIINLDDVLKSLTKVDAGLLKNIITQDNVTIRMPYAKYLMKGNRIANFIASINEADFIDDPTGSRRWLPFEVESIDIKAAQAFDINEFWTDAYYRYKAGEKYWFDKEETAEWFKGNENFKANSLEKDLILTYFVIPDDPTKAKHRLSNGDIMKILGDYTNQRLSPKKLGNALTELGAKKSKVQLSGRGAQVYYVTRKTQLEVEQEQQNTYLK
jgi:predicted P-loop ATPase